MHSTKKRLHSTSAYMFICLSAGCGAMPNQYEDLKHTYYAYDTVEPRVFEEYMFTPNGNPYRSTPVLIPLSDITVGGCEGWDAAEDTRCKTKIDIDKADRYIMNYPPYRFPAQLYGIADKINPSLGGGPERIIGIRPLAIAFVDAPIGQFSAKVAEARSEIGSPEMAVGRRLIILPDANSLDESVTKIVLYPETMTLRDAEKIMFHVPGPDFVATLFTMSKPIKIREAISMVGSPAQFLEVASREKIIVTFERLDPSHAP